MEKTEKVSQKKAINFNAMAERDRTPVRGIFDYFECPGGKLEFNYKKYKDEPVLSYKTCMATGRDTALYDGQIYTLPLGVARHLNKNGWYPIHAYAVDEDGKNKITIGKKVRRFGFRSLEFMDVDDLTPEGESLITIERSSVK